MTTKTGRSLRSGYEPPQFHYTKAAARGGEYRPVIDRRYRLEDVVGAHRYVETRQKTGNVVLSLNGGPR